MVNVNGNDPLGSLFNSIELVKNALGPIESGFRKAAKDFEHCWPGGNDGSKTLEFSKGNRDDGNENKVQCFSMTRKDGQDVISDDRKKGLSINAFLGIFSNVDESNGNKVDICKKGFDVGDGGKEDSTCVNCMHVAAAWSVLVSSFVQNVPGALMTGKKNLHKKSNEEKLCKYPCASSPKSNVSCGNKHLESKHQLLLAPLGEPLNVKCRNNLSIQCFIGFVIDQLAQNLQKFELGVQEGGNDQHDLAIVPPSTNQADHLKAVTSLLEGKKADFSGFLGNLKFARVGGVPSSIVDVTPSDKDGNENDVSSAGTEEIRSSLPQKMASSLLSIPLSNVERLRSTLSTVSLTELIELIPQLGRSPKDYPDKKKLFSVQDFFRYTEAEGRRFFEELDRDGDGQVNLEDLEVAIRKRRLPRRYAHEFMRRARRHLFSNSFGWKQFLSVMEQKEATILRAYTSLCLSKSGTLKKSEILESLKNAGLPANEDNAVAMMRFLKSDMEESVSYGHFRNFMLLLPSERLQEDPRNIWFEAATVVAVAPPVEVPTGNVLKSALAGGLACALSTSVMHPIDTIKTRVQASTLTFPEILAKLPEVGVRGVYRGAVPAIIGQFSSHGLRTGIFEATKLVLINVAPNLPDLQVQSVASFCSTVLGTAVRIPCEVLKQRLQAGIFNNVGQALVCTWQQDGLRGFFRGTGATLCREVPFYVAGMGLYGESKKAAQRILGRELEPWETIAVGALSGGLAAVTTTPFDVMKTRMMTAPQGRPISMSIVALSILRHEGPLGLFKGAIPRFFWIAPLGAMNFAGYELMKNAMAKSESEQAAEQQVSQK